MPLYDLACNACNAVSEAFIPLADFGKPLPSCVCGGAQRRLIRPLMVMADIQPYQAMATDVATGKAPMITSRSEHRDYLKRNNLVEIGNEVPKASREEIKDKDIARQVKRAIDEKGIRL